MHMVTLSPHLSDQPHAIERGEEAAIVGEVARHLLEYREVTSESRCAALLQKLTAIHQLNPDALWLFLGLLTGDLSAVTESYKHQGEARALDKQAMQQRTERALHTLQIHYPEVAHAIIQLRHITAKIP